jgi:uncharacterized damage-inducible protein DinB
MSFSQALLPEFDQEMANTRKTLERVPDNKFAWRPHEKSSSMGALAAHVATLPSWVGTTMSTSELDIGQPFTPPKADTRAELLALFDQNVASARAAIASAPDAEFMKPWSLKVGDKTMFTIPRAAVLRSFFMNHIIHHRAQLTVYLRLNNLPVPSLYGPSADEGGF